jgi:hypothetical protein
MFRLILIIVLGMIFYSFLKKLISAPPANPHVKNVPDTSKKQPQKKIKTNIEDADFEELE